MGCLSEVRLPAPVTVNGQSAGVVKVVARLGVVVWVGPRIMGYLSGSPQVGQERSVPISSAAGQVPGASSQSLGAVVLAGAPLLAGVVHRVIMSPPIIPKRGGAPPVGGRMVLPPNSLFQGEVGFSNVVH